MDSIDNESRSGPLPCKVVLVAIGVLVSGIANASTYSGTVARADAQPSPSAPSTQARITVYTSTAATTACSAPSLYSFDLSNPAASQSLQALLLVALTTNAQVTITGTGTCDAYGIEMIQDISVFAP